MMSLMKEGKSDPPESVAINENGDKIIDESNEGNCDDRRDESIDKKCDETRDESSDGRLPFTRKSYWTDLRLEMDSQELYVPKSHLALVSPVFRRMLESDFKEKHLDVLPLPGKKYDDVLTFLMCTHPGALLKVTHDVVPKVLPLAHEYQVKWLLDDCTNAMMAELDSSKFTNTNPNYLTQTESELYAHCSNICIMAEKYDISCVIERFIERFSSLNYKLYKDLSEFKQVSIEVRYSIVCGRLDSKEGPDICVFGSVAVPVTSSRFVVSRRGAKK